MRFGNIFIDKLAGYESTASILALAIALITAYRRWQGRVNEELDAVVDDSSGTGIWGYKKFIPKINRCLAKRVLPICYGVSTSCSKSI